MRVREVSFRQTSNGGNSSNSRKCLTPCLRSLSAGKLRTGLYFNQRHSYGTACTGFCTLFLGVLFLVLFIEAIADTYTKRFRETTVDQGQFNLGDVEYTIYDYI